MPPTTIRARFGFITRFEIQEGKKVYEGGMGYLVVGQLY